MTARTAIFFIWLAAAITAPWASAVSADLPKPKGRVILTVSGDIANTNNAGQADFDLPMLHALGLQSLSTTTSWTDGTQNFSGIWMRTVLEAVGARGKTVEAVALNDYTYEIEIEDFSHYPVLLATKLNGNILKIRDKGPLWIVYPLDRFSETEKTIIERRMVWQLRRLIVK